MSERLLKELERDLAQLGPKKLKRSLIPIPSKRVQGRLGALLDFSSNDYLGLSSHPAVIQASVHALKEWGSGSGASRLISGNYLIHEQLEKEIASFKKEEAATIFSSGYLANLGAVATLANAGDLVLIDRLNHASLIDAARLSGTKLWVYPHLDLTTLEGLLARAKNFRRRFVITDAYFSMDGHVAPLDEILKLCRKYDALLMIDEAHSTGVFGKTGRGLTEHFSLSGQIPVVMGTLSKALGSVGGFIAGSSVLKETLTNFCRPFIFTTAPAPASSAASLEALLQIKKNQKMLKDYWRKIDLTRQELKKLSLDLMGSQGPIIPILIGDTKKVLKARDYLKSQGVWAAAVRPPTVPKGTDRIRLSLSAAHSEEDLRFLIKILAGMMKKI